MHPFCRRMAGNSAQRQRGGRTDCRGIYGQGEQWGYDWRNLRTQSGRISFTGHSLIVLSCKGFKCSTGP